MSRAHFWARALTICAGIAIFADDTLPTFAETSVSLFRNSRPVTSAEAAGGAPADGMVHEFFATTDSDILGLSANIDVPLYLHPYGNEASQPHPVLVGMYPGLGAHSFLATPSGASLYGGGFSGPGPERVWADMSRDGAQTNFQFGRLTTTQVGSFTGDFVVWDETKYVHLPFSFSLPGSAGPLSETLAISTEQSLAPPSAPLEVQTPVIEPQPSVPDAQPSVPAPKFDPFAYSEYSDADTPVSVALTRRTRPVTGQEIAAGAPDGYVHEFFVRSSTDVIDIRDVALDVSVYQHKDGVDNRFVDATRLLMFPGVSADSFLDTPGKTSVEGGFATAYEDSNAIWYDRFNNGPQDEFLFSRLTVGESGHFSGAVSVAGPNGRVELPFNFVLPGTAEDLALIDQEPRFSLGFSHELPAESAASSALRQIPEPSAVSLVALAVLFTVAVFPRRQSRERAAMSH
jgi:hypothetical protein